MWEFGEFCSGNSNREVCHASVGDHVGKKDVFLAEFSSQRVATRCPSRYEVLLTGTNSRLMRYVIMKS